MTDKQNEGLFEIELITSPSRYGLFGLVIKLRDREWKFGNLV